VLVSEGDRVQAEDGLVTLESDKATMEVPAPAAGTIRELRLKLNDRVSQGDLVAILEVEEAAMQEAPAAAGTSREPEPPREPAQARDVVAAAATGAEPGEQKSAAPQPAAAAAGQQDPKADWRRPPRRPLPASA